MTTKKVEPEFLRNLTGRAMLPEDKIALEKYEKMFKECAEESAAWPFRSPIPKKKRKKK